MRPVLVLKRNNHEQLMVLPSLHWYIPLNNIKRFFFFKQVINAAPSHKHKSRILLMVSL